MALNSSWPAIANKFPGVWVRAYDANTLMYFAPEEKIPEALRGENLEFYSAPEKFGRRIPFTQFPQNCGEVLKQFKK